MKEVLNFGSQFAFLEASTETHDIWRLSQVMPLNEVKKHFAKNGITNKVMNPHSTHSNPISTYWLVEK